MNVRKVEAAQAGPFALVYEMGPGNHIVERFETESKARQQAATFWCCWCLFSQRPGGDLSEIATGGYGLAMTRTAIRKYAMLLNPLAAGVAFANRPDWAVVGDTSIGPKSRVTFGIVYPSGLGIQSHYMYFDKEKPVERVVASACSRADLILEKGRLAGSPERLNLFTLEGDLVRLDLEVEAHLGSTLTPGAILVLEKGNRVADNRLSTIKQVLSNA